MFLLLMHYNVSKYALPGPSSHRNRQCSVNIYNINKKRCGNLAENNVIKQSHTHTPYIITS